MDDQNRNLILASVLSFLVIVVWFVLFPPPDPNTSENVDTVQSNTASNTDLPDVGLNSSVTADEILTTADEVPRINISSDKLSGTISLKGGRIDDLSLLGYKVDMKKGSENVTLLRPFWSARCLLCCIWLGFLKRH